MMTGLVATILGVFLRFISGELLKLIRDRRVQALALSIVQRAAGTELDNDEKRKLASKELRQEAVLLGIDLGENYANALIELAVSKLKERATKD